LIMLLNTSLNVVGDSFVEELIFILQNI
jgi:hypothetical protein